MGNKQSNLKYKDLNNYGKLSINGDRYIGELVNNVKTGKGIMEFKNGDIYEGHWFNDEMEGKGKYQYENGDIYIGEMKNNHCHGIGEINYANGYSSKGNFSFDKINGNGVLYGLNNIKIYEGKWKNNNFHGIGKLFHEPGTKFYSGKFINGICHGYGKLYNPEGKNIYSGGFNNGELEDYINDEYLNEINDLIEDYNNFIYSGCLKKVIASCNIPIVSAEPISPSAPELKQLCLVCNETYDLIKYNCGHEVICRNCFVESQVNQCFQCETYIDRIKYI